jgi:hypothetical protein
VGTSTAPHMPLWANHFPQKSFDALQAGFEMGTPLANVWTAMPPAGRDGIDQECPRANRYEAMFF